MQNYTNAVKNPIQMQCSLYNYTLHRFYVSTHTHPSVYLLCMQRTGTEVHQRAGQSQYNPYSSVSMVLSVSILANVFITLKWHLDGIQMHKCGLVLLCYILSAYLKHSSIFVGVFFMVCCCLSFYIGCVQPTQRSKKYAGSAAMIPTHMQDFEMFIQRKGNCGLQTEETRGTVGCATSSPARQINPTEARHN